MKNQPKSNVLLKLVIKSLILIIIAWTSVCYFGILVGLFEGWFSRGQPIGEFLWISIFLSVGMIYIIKAIEYSQRLIRGLKVCIKAK